MKGVSILIQCRAYNIGRSQGKKARRKCTRGVEAGIAHYVQRLDYGVDVRASIPGKVKRLFCSQ
jgi:hypothetical protein